MRFVTADHAARAFLELRERASSPRNQSMTVVAGVSLASRCPRCATPDRILGSARGTGRLWRCKRCGAPWPEEAVEVPRTYQARGAAVNAIESRMANVATLALLLGRLKTWERRVLLLYASGRFSLEGLAEECAERWPRRTVAWSYYRVRSDLREARVALERQLRRAGLMAGGE